MTASIQANYHGFQGESGVWNFGLGLPYDAMGCLQDDILARVSFIIPLVGAAWPWIAGSGICLGLLQTTASCCVRVYLAYQGKGFGLWLIPAAISMAFTILIIPLSVLKHICSRCAFSFGTPPVAGATATGAEVSWFGGGFSIWLGIGRPFFLILVRILLHLDAGKVKKSSIDGGEHSTSSRGLFAGKETMTSWKARKRWLPRAHVVPSISFVTPTWKRHAHHGLLVLFSVAATSWREYTTKAPRGFFWSFNSCITRPGWRPSSWGA